MNDQPNLRQFLDEVNSFADETPAGSAPDAKGAIAQIGDFISTVQR